jgi:hypothetical protein
LMARIGLPPVAVPPTAVESTATRRQRAAKQRSVGWVKKVLTGRDGQRDGRDGFLTGPRVENIVVELLYAQKQALKCALEFL